MKQNSFFRKHLIVIEVLGLAVLLLFAYVIGQQVISPLRQNESQKESVESSAADNSIWGDYEFEIQGSNETDDNPWGFTAGIINMDNIGECVLLTPNTSLILEDISSKTTISLEFMIHPWVSESSDGAGILVHFRDIDGNIIGEDRVDISSEESWKLVEYSAEQYRDLNSIEFLCNNGLSGDDTADWVVIKTANNLSTFNENGYVKSATYFSDEWPINFWNSEMDDLEEELFQIREDGFNSIILVIPWKEFQSSTVPIEYNEYAFEKLDSVMRAASEVGLDVYTRIGYTWDYYNDLNESITERLLDIMRDPNVHAAWLDYAEKVYGGLKGYKNFKNGFLTWEDFWGCLAVCDTIDESMRVEYAAELGYQEWVKSNYSLDEYNTKYLHDFMAFEDIPIPMRSEPAMECMYDFFDNYLNSILRDTQQVFPNISMEVRLDADLVVNGDGEYEYYFHTATYACEESDYTATMYGIPMGFENKGEKVSSTEALKQTEYILSNLLAHNNGKPVYVEQFLFMDNTPQFSYNAQIRENEIDDYLAEVSEVLSEYTGGYGIWTYRDYRNNMLYNSQFALEDKGWVLNGNSEFYRDMEVESLICNLSEGSSIFQEVPEIRNHFDSEKYIVMFDVTECEEVSELLVSIGEESEIIEIQEPGTYEIKFDKNSSFDFKISVLDGEVSIDNLCLFSFIQEGHLYNENNEEMDYIGNIRMLNEELEHIKNID